MGRIAEAEIERLKREVSVERLAEAKGVKLMAHGKDRLGRCPFHDDRTPSLVITPGTNLWHCLGACQAGGSSIDWVMRAEGVSFRKAVELLRADSPSLAEPIAPAAHGRQQSPVPKASTTLKLPVIGERSGDDEALLRDVVGFYHATLKESPEALGYLAKRGLQMSTAMRIEGPSPPFDHVVRGPDKRNPSGNLSKLS
jgi:DNA primase